MNGVLIISRKVSQASFDKKSKDSKIPSTWSFFMFSFQYNLNGDVTSKVIFQSILSFDIFSTSFMDVISPTRFVNHPYFMDYGNYLNNPFVLIIPDKTNLEGKL